MHARRPAGWLFAISIAAALGCGTAATRPAHATEASERPATTAERASETAGSDDDATSGACALAMSPPRVLRAGARWPRVALGDDGLVVGYGVAAPTPEGQGRARDDVLFVAAPVLEGEIRDVFTRGRTLEASREWTLGPFPGQVAGHGAIVTCFHDDFCADSMDGPGGDPPCDAWACDLRVPGDPSLDAHFALAHRHLGFGTAVAFREGTVFAAAAAYQGGAMPGIFGFFVEGGRAQGVLLHSFPDDAIPGTGIEIAIVPEGADSALVRWSAPRDPRPHAVRLTRAGRADARVGELPTEPLAIVERRATERARPYLAAVIDGAEAPSAELASDAGRFAPTLLAMGEHRVLVFSEGLGATTRVRAVVVDGAGRPRGEPIDVSAAGVEAGCASADARGDAAAIVWEEHAADGWRLVAATAACR